MSVDLLDKKILYQLDMNARQTNKAIARKLKTSAEVVRYRIQRMEKEGIIKYYMAIIDPERLGYYHYENYFRFQGMTEKKENELISYMKQHNNILWLASCSGHYDIVFSVIAKNNIEFNEIIEDITKHYGEYIFERNIQTTIQIPHFTRNYLIKKPHTKNITYRSGEKRKEKIDEKDFKILHHIMNNGREQLIDISRELEESIDTIHYRLKKLEKNNIINTYRIFLDKEKIGHQLNQILFQFKGLHRSLKMEFIEYAKTIDKAVYVLDTIGKYDLIIELEPESNEEFNTILKQIRNRFSQRIINYATITITKEHQMDYFKIDEKKYFCNED